MKERRVSNKYRLEEVLVQAKSYARFLTAKYCVIDEQEKIWATERRDCYESVIFETAWEQLNNTDVFNDLNKMIGRENRGGNSLEWKNSLFDGGNEIHEDVEDTRHEDWIPLWKHDLSVLRLVFVKRDPKEPYRFVGVYRSGKMEFLHHTYERIATRVKLIGNPVNQIELHDDNRE